MKDCEQMEAKRKDQITIKYDYSIGKNGKVAAIALKGAVVS